MDIYPEFQLCMTKDKKVMTPIVRTYYMTQVKKLVGDINSLNLLLSLKTTSVFSAYKNCDSDEC